jgi:hypothetical protein
MRCGMHAICFVPENMRRTAAVGGRGGRPPGAGAVIGTVAASTLITRETTNELPGNLKRIVDFFLFVNFLAVPESGLPQFLAANFNLETVSYARRVISMSAFLFRYFLCA